MVSQDATFNSKDEAPASLIEELDVVLKEAFSSV
ncbi:MAG: hypothetical protein B6229_06590 [Spirochaetaceae bacterium 4572_7]|nr:MAG: hypothetical protein B6229_06590 [Spirochaetaceae bacterium 4572_7]